MANPDRVCHYGEIKNTTGDFAIMPWDDRRDTLTENNLIIWRWDFIKRELQKEITCVQQLIDVIKSYNLISDGTGKQVKPPWKFTALIQYFNEIQKYEIDDFFKNCGILCTIMNLALQAHELIPQIKLLKSGMESCLTLHQLQIASLLACAFMCIFTKRDSDYPTINFNKLFDGPEQGSPKPFVEKIKCIVHYFRRINEKQPSGNVSYYRLHISDHRLPRWDRTTVGLCRLRVESYGKIEDQEGFLQMDFANRFVGGGVLGRGCVQEEIRFVINPELIAARLFTECLSDNEALFVVGAERYCRYTGFSDTFRFDGDYRDTTPLDDTNHKKIYIIVLDALCYSYSSEQYREGKILRELKKAYVGFKPIEKSSPLPLATGNWGCGAFRGDPQLKSVLQLMAASQAGRDMLYLTFGDACLKKEIEELYKLLKDRNINVGGLYQIVRHYGRKRNKNQTLFHFIRDMIFERITAECVIRCGCSGLIANKVRSLFSGSNAILSSVPKSSTANNENKINTCATSSEINAYYSTMCKKMLSCSVTQTNENFSQELKTRDTNRRIFEKPQNHSSPLNEDSNGSQCRNRTSDLGDSDCSMENTPKSDRGTEADVKMPESSQSSKAGVQDSTSNGMRSSVLTPGMISRQRIQMNDVDDVKPKPKKLIQKKITDCFPKK